MDDQFDPFGIVGNVVFGEKRCQQCGTGLEFIDPFDRDVNFMFCPKCNPAIHAPAESH